MRRFFITVFIFALVVCALAVPAFATWEDSNLVVVDYLDYADSDHVEIDSNQSYVVIDIPADFAESVFVQDGDGHFANGETDDAYIPNGNNDIKYLCFPTLDYQYTIGRTNSGYLFDTSNFPDGTTIAWEWTVDLTDYDGTIVNNLGAFDYYTYFFGVPDEFGMSYMFGRSSIFGLPAYADSKQIVAYCEYTHGGNTVGTATNYVAPCIRFSSLTFSDLPAKFTVKTSSIKVTIPITDDLLDFAQSEKTNKLLTEVNRQLNEQGQTMKDVLAEQEQTNEKLDDITGYVPEADTPEGGEVVGDLENVEDNLMDDVNGGFDEAEQLQLSVLETLLQYVTAFGAVSYIIDLFAWIPFIKILLSVSLALGIVATLLNIGLSVSSGASKAKTEGKHGAKDKHSAGHH